MKTSRSALFNGYLLLAFMVAGCTAVQPVAPAASPDAGAAPVPQTMTPLRVAGASFSFECSFLHRPGGRVLCRRGFGH